MQIIEYGRDVGTKFNKDGTVKYFPGNTIICNVARQSETFKILCITKEMVAKLIDRYKYTFLPESSYHMTVIEGICDKVRNEKLWTNIFPLETALEKIDIFFKEQYENIKVPYSFSMKYNSFDIGDVIIIKLIPAADEDSKKIKEFRNKISAKFGLRFPDHDNYLFHITLAYNIVKEGKDDKKKIDYIKERVHNYLKDNFGIFKTSSPELMFFNDMFEFTKTRRK